MASKEILDLVTKIEFNEKKSKQWRVPVIEARFYVKDLKKFVKLCTEGAGRKFDDRFWKIYMERCKRSKAKSPHFQCFIAHKQVEVYPKENTVAVQDVGIHYVCQHSFDIFPSEVRSIFYDHLNPVKLGVLHTLKGETLDVYSSDIHDGFMMAHQIINQKFYNNFSRWIRYCNEKRRKAER